MGGDGRRRWRSIEQAEHTQLQSLICLIGFTRLTKHSLSLNINIIRYEQRERWMKWYDTLVRKEEE